MSGAARSGLCCEAFSSTPAGLTCRSQRSPSVREPYLEAFAVVVRAVGNCIWGRLRPWVNCYRFICAKRPNYAVDLVSWTGSSQHYHA